MKYTEEQLELIELGRVQNEKIMMLTGNTEKQMQMVKDFKENVLLSLKYEKAVATERIQELKIVNRHTEDEELKKENNLEVEVLKLKLQKIKFNKNFYQIDNKIQSKQNELTIIKMERIHKKDKVGQNHEKN